MDVLALAGGGGGGSGFDSPLWWVIDVVLVVLAGIGLFRYFDRKR